MSDYLSSWEIVGYKNLTQVFFFLFSCDESHQRFLKLFSFFLFTISKLFFF